ncbi:MAG: hypothetical protein JXR12_06730 [Neptunomonas phycophila]|uniref:hypothetical protein n=1 Tax=Neptunomonas phycophila TaxID=1572645 RepID=UPI003B8E63E8
MDEKTVKAVFGMLMGAAFEEWYENDFQDYVEGEEGCKSKEEIQADIKRML